MDLDFDKSDPKPNKIMHFRTKTNAVVDTGFSSGFQNSQYLKTLKYFFKVQDNNFKELFQAIKKQSTYRMQRSSNLDPSINETTFQNDFHMNDAWTHAPHHIF